MSKQEYVKCPRCELNWILKGQELCDVCKAELNYDGSHIEEEDEDIEEFLEDEESELCPVCKVNYIDGKESMCESCRMSKFDDMEKTDDDWSALDDKSELAIEDDEDELISLSAMEEEENEEIEEAEKDEEDFDDLDIDSLSGEDFDDFGDDDLDEEDI